jgi:lipoprotein-releasing system ATP-binding protein
MEPNKVQTVLRARNLYKEFTKKNPEGDERIEVVRGVNLDIEQGDCVAIMGSSGAGKSTLLHLLGGLDRPSRGEVWFGPKNLWTWSDEELSNFRNLNLGFVFQFHYLLPEFTAVENVMMPALIAGYTHEEANRAAMELIEFVGLKHRALHRPSELSGGEQQRVSVARSVILKPKLLLGDELTGNLDSENSRKVIDLILSLNRNFGISVLLVTHDSEIASRMKRVLVMKDGKIVSS